MRIVMKDEFDGTRAELLAAVDDWRAQCEAHKATVGVPAPWPSHEVLRELAEMDPAGWEVEADVEPGEEEIETPAPRTTVEDLERILRRAGLIDDKALEEARAARGAPLPPTAVAAK